MTAQKARDTQVTRLATDTTVYRSRSWNRLRFEVEYGREKGTTANAYIIEGDRIAVIDPPGESFCELFLDAVTQRLDVTSIDYVIISHINPNRAATLQKILDIAPQVTIVCSNPGAKNLRLLLPKQPLDIEVMRGVDDEYLDLGKGHRLQFLRASTPRYPEELLTYDPKTRILYSDKFFGAHICGTQVFDEGWEVYQDDRQYYFDCIMAPHARQVTLALEKIEDFARELSAKHDEPANLSHIFSLSSSPHIEPSPSHSHSDSAHPSAKDDVTEVDTWLSTIAFYAPNHGPMVRYGLSELTNLYKQWSLKQQQQELTVAMLYASAYGNTTALAQALARGITKAGVQVESINCESATPDEIKSIVERAAGFVIGSPTLGGHAPTQIQAALGIIISNVSKDRLAGVFGSYGWSGEAIDLLGNKLKDAGYSFGFDPIRVKFKPTEQALKSCEEAGTDFAQALKKTKKRRKPRQISRDSFNNALSTISSTEEAVGRIVGSLAIVTATCKELSSGMLASWIAQATFNPPGFTVAVAKERAVESLMFPGCTFVLNILPENNHRGLMKHFLKPFEPGEDRFKNIDIDTAENGSPILKGASAYLECTVDSRMECGDHWVVYATVKQGKVLDASVKTAVHHRKTGSRY
ncbi:MAG: diflavin flavoprotein [Cyanobacteria bacterium P01_F01_bin.150]